MIADNGSPYTALDPLAPPIYRQVWMETVFKHRKLDPQIGDTSVLADFPLVLSKSAWQELAGLAEKLAAEKAKQATPAGSGEQPPAPIEFASDKDFQFLQALNHLKGLPVQTAQGPQAPEPKGAQSKKN